MEILSKPYGYVLIFPDIQDLKTNVALLTKFMEHVEKEKIEPPHLIAYYCLDTVTTDFMEKELSGLKYKWLITPPVPMPSGEPG